MTEYERILSKYTYAELRLEQSFESHINIKDDEVRHSSGSSSGLSVRVLEDGSWGFASSSKGGDVGELLQRAHRLASLAKGKIQLADYPAEKKTLESLIEPTDSDEQVRALLGASKDMVAQGISSRIISCTDALVSKEFYSSNGREIRQVSGYSYLSCSCIARSGGILQRGSERTWSRSGFGNLDLAGTAGKSREKTLRLLGAGPPPKGRFTAVFDPEMTGVFSHEAIGHACEADSVIDRESILSDKKGKTIGNSLVSIIDDPSADDFGRYSYDDEGMPGKPTTLVEKGVLRGFMNSLETARELSIEPNGHARAQNYSSVPIVRMSNTYFQKGDHSIEEVFDIPSGIYLKGMKGGSVDIFSGGFMFKAEEAYEIKKGEKGNIMRDVTITGNVLQTMLDVEAVGNDFGNSPGVCGKGGQEAPVSDGGPHIRVRNVALG